MPRAFKCFLQQDYDNRELLVLDDGSDIVRDLVPDDLRIKYFYELPKKNYGQKINRCVEFASGEFVIHWDSDDGHAPDRISRQSLPLIANPALQVSGTSTLYYYRHPHLSNPLQHKGLVGSLSSHSTGAYQYTGHKQAWLGGIAYRKALAVERPFDVDPKPGTPLVPPVFARQSGHEIELAGRPSDLGLTGS